MRGFRNVAVRSRVYEVGREPTAAEPAVDLVDGREDRIAERDIPFKVNAVADKNGETWRRLFHEFNLNRDEFNARYHLRSNVESAFSMIKAKFRDHVRSKTDEAMTSEVLAKILCHNVVVCIHEMFALGIAVEFGGEKTEDIAEVDEPRILRFPGA